MAAPYVSHFQFKLNSQNIYKPSRPCYLGNWSENGLVLLSSPTIEKYDQNYLLWFFQKKTLSLDVESEVCQILSRGEEKLLVLVAQVTWAAPFRPVTMATKPMDLYFFISRLGSQFLSIEKDLVGIIYFSFGFLYILLLPWTTWTTNRIERFAIQLLLPPQKISRLKMSRWWIVLTTGIYLAGSANIFCRETKRQETLGWVFFLRIDRQSTSVADIRPKLTLNGCGQTQRLLLPYRPGLLYWWHFLFIIPWILFYIGKNSIFKVGSGGSNKHTSLSLKVSTKLIAGPKDLGIIVERIDPSILGSTLGVDSYTVYSTNTFEDNIHTEILVPVVVFNGRCGCHVDRAGKPIPLRIPVFSVYTARIGN